MHEQRTAGPHMSALLMTGLLAGCAFTAVTIHDLQLRLEQWDYRKHEED